MAVPQRADVGRVGVRLVESAMKIRVCLAILVAAAGLATLTPVRASVELEVVVNIHFTDTCEETSGYWGVWNASYEDRDALFAEYPPEPVTWSATMPMEGRYVGGSSETGDDYRIVLFVADPRTVVFERRFDIRRTEDGRPYWIVDTLLDCSTVPYSEVPSPDTAMRPGENRHPVPAGLVLILAAVSLALRVGFLAGRFRHEPGSFRR